LQAGYNWQNGQFVFGGETDLQVTGADDTFAPYKFSNPWFGTLRARAGYAMNNILLYGTLGLAYGGVKGELGGLDESKTHTGWTGGLGMEVGFTPNWSTAPIRSPASTTACRPTCCVSASTITFERAPLRWKKPRASRSGVFVFALVACKNFT
jgi:hypothetical protein